MRCGQVEFGGSRAETFLLLAELRGHHVGKILRTEYRADLDLVLGVTVAWIGITLNPLDRVRHRRRLYQPETRDQLLRLGERAIHHCPRGTGKPHTRALRAR